MPLDYQDVSDLCESLHNDFSIVRDDAMRRYDLYRMKKEPYVPEEIAREGKVRMLTSLLMNSAETIRADLLMNPTEFTVLPLAREKDGATLKKYEKYAENLERSIAVLWGRLNEGRRIDYDIIWHQLVSPYGILMLEFPNFEMPDQPEGMDDAQYNILCEQAEESFLPWKIYLPDPLTCAWAERDGRPIVFTRKYKVLVRDIEKMYSHNVASENPDKKIVYDDGRWKWVTDDYQRTTSRAKSGFEEVEVIYMDDGEYMYQAVQAPGADANQGVMLSCVPNPVGRVCSFIVPGNTTPSRAPEERYEPFLLPLMQALNQVNDIRSMRATAARNLAGPHTYVTIDPEVQKLYATKGEKLPTEVTWRKNKTPYLLGKVEVLPSELSNDWDKLEERINEDLQRLLPSPFINVVDPAVLKSATATSILHAAEAGLRIYGPLMSAYDSAIRDICEAIILSVQNGAVDSPITLFASGEEMAHGKNLKEGSVNLMNQDSVSFAHKLLVRTRSMSRAQAAAQYEAVLAQWILPDGSKGPATFDDLIDAANFTDREGQKMKLATEAIIQSIMPWLQQMAVATAHEKILVESGLDLPLMPPQQTGQPDPSGMPNSAQRMDAPMITGPEGGSSPGG